MEQGCSELTSPGSWSGPGPGGGGSDGGDGIQLSVEERMRAAYTTCQALQAKVERLTQLNQQLNQCVEDKEREKEGSNKTIAMLEFNIEHNKNKVQNMELTLQLLKEEIETLKMEKERLVRQLREGSSSGLYDQLTQEKEEVKERLTLAKDELERQLKREKRELEERLTRQGEEMEERHRAESKALQDQLEGLSEIRQGYEKQINQIELNNAEMHGKIGAVQVERDTARSQATELSTQKQKLEEKMEELGQSKAGLEQEVLIHKGTISSLEGEVEAREGKVRGMSEAAGTLQNNVLNLQKQVEGLNQTCGKLARDLEAESKLRIDTQAQLAQTRQALRQLEENPGVVNEKTQQALEDRLGADGSSKDQVDGQQENHLSLALSEAKAKCAEFQTRVTELEADKRALTNRLTAQGDVGTDQLSENTLTNLEQRNSDDEVVRLRTVVKDKDEELNRIRQSLKDVQERLSLAEVLSGEVEEQRGRATAAEKQLAAAEREHQKRILAVEADAERRVADTQQLCHQTISTAFDQQDNETSVLVRQQQEVLRDAQNRAREKAAQLDSVVQEYETKLQDKDEELCRFVQQYEEQLESLRCQHETQVKEVEAAWQARAEKTARQREAHKQEEMDQLTHQWNKERRELERLTQVAAAAFRSGTESVELLKKQVGAQRRELEDVKLNHVKEMNELKALLELKRRSRGSGSGGGGGNGGIRLGVQLEEAAEFEYLKNILYQYMLGKETRTLSKVLCAVVKFDSRQQQEILEHEEEHQSLVKAVNGSLQSEIVVKNGGSDHSKTL